MATIAAIRQRVRDRVYSSAPEERPWLDITSTGLENTTDVDMTVPDGANWAKGDVAEFYVDGEQVLVTSISGNILTVSRGWNSTTAAVQADNTIVAKNPRFTLQQIDDATEEVCRSLEGYGVHAFGYGNVTLVTGRNSYDVSEIDISSDYGILSAYYERDDDFVVVPLAQSNPSLIHQSLITSKRTILLPSWGDRQAGDFVWYTYAKVIDGVDDLLPRQEELVVLGATARVLRGAVVPRTNDPGRYTDRTVQPGQPVRDSNPLVVEFMMLARREAAQLAAERDSLPGTSWSRRARSWRP